MFVDSKLLIFLSFGTFNTVLRDVNGKEGDIFRLESFQIMANGASKFYHSLLSEIPQGSLYSFKKITPRCVVSP